MQCDQWSLPNPNRCQNWRSRTYQKNTQNLPKKNTQNLPKKIHRTYQKIHKRICFNTYANLLGRLNEASLTSVYSTGSSSSSDPSSNTNELASPSTARSACAHKVSVHRCGTNKSYKQMQKTSIMTCRRRASVYRALRRLSAFDPVATSSYWVCN